MVLAHLAFRQRFWKQVSQNIILSGTSIPLHSLPNKLVFARFGTVAHEEQLLRFLLTDSVADSRDTITAPVVQ